MTAKKEKMLRYSKKMPKMEGQQIIRVSAHAILQSKTLYIL